MSAFLALGLFVMAWILAGPDPAGRSEDMPLPDDPPEVIP